ncbi:hypothetical protein AB1L42_14100, partial [Thalassoglobus sp. JC818]|uniref:hypothetical protein n=1 Tax=Thalassoglobus sp. JC818 TaxID=3232136 RepID=UPI00345747E6
MSRRSIGVLVLLGILASSTLLFAQELWSIAPAGTRAVVVVANIESFSNQIDSLAKEMRLLQPGVLESAKQSSKIRTGLDPTGPLLWFYGPPSKSSSPIAYLLPATNPKKLISQLDPQREGPWKRVTIGGTE